MRNQYAHRRLTEGCPGIDQLALHKYVSIVDARRDDAPRVNRLMKYFGKLIDLTNRKDVVVLGCGPKPHPMAVLIRRGYNVVGVEPIPSFVESATEFLGAPGTVVEGNAECIPLPTESCDIAFLESALEHVDSPTKSLEEVFRVLRPDGIAFLTTTNKFRVSPTGWNGEFNVPFYNWLPSIVKESFVFDHLHYNPALANFTERPAVHWFSFGELCALVQRPVSSRPCQNVSVILSAAKDPTYDPATTRDPTYDPATTRDPSSFLLRMTMALIGPGTCGIHHLGRLVGFGQFYSLLDLQDQSDESVTGGRGPLKTLVRGVALNAVHASPWLRALVLTTTQWGGDIIMFKRDLARE